ncbi:ATP-binding protein [Leucobacter massiliensis]|uniref:ATP-binding protein n=1 Tax=Leucobacter massiliensis TaxID=1686285 RepID=UPI0015E31552|nr:ATP-binding protein [Leucobacter massiliensis]
MTGDGGPRRTEYTLEGFAVPEQLDAVHTLLAQAAGDHPWLDPTDVMLFETAIIEIANNVVEYGRPEGEVRWKFTIRVHEEEIEAELEDTGQTFTPEHGREMPGEDAEGGRGLALAEAVLDQIEFQRFEDTNHWRMVRRLGGLARG